MDAQSEIKKALVHMRKVQTWLNKNTEDGVTLDKKLTYPEEAKLLGLATTKMYSHLDILKCVYKYIEINGLLEDKEHPTLINLDKTLKRILKTDSNTLHIFEISSRLK